MSDPLNPGFSAGGEDLSAGGEPSLLVEGRGINPVPPEQDCENVMTTTQTCGGLKPENLGVNTVKEKSLNPRVFVENNVWFHRAKLSEILEDENIEVLHCSPLDGILERLSREVLPIDLILLPFMSGNEAELELLAKIRELPRLMDVPVLGLSTIDHDHLDFDRLRLLGVVGLINRNALPEHVLFRVNSIVRKDTTELRRFARAPAFFAVDLDADGQVSCEYATNLSCGGLRIASSRALPRGTEVAIQFRLPSSSGCLIEAHGNVVWTGKTNRSDIPRHRLGVFFEPLDADSHDLVSREVQAILELSDW